MSTVGRTRATSVRPGPAAERSEADGLDADSAAALRLALRAARDGDFSVRLPVRGQGLAGELASEFNELVATNDRMARELVRVARIIGQEGRMTERATLDGAGGAWATNIESANSLIDDLVRPTTEVARVIEAVAEGDLSQKMALKIEGQPVKGEFLRIGRTVNQMVDQLSSFADEVSRVAREVGTDGKLGGQAEVKGVSGTWKDLTENVNGMASNLTDQVRNIALVTTAVAGGDLTQKITVDARGEIAGLKNTINTMVDQLSSFADEVTRVAREVGTDGKLGGQAEVEGVSGTWRDLTENVNGMASNLTNQVRNIAQVATAVARGDLTQKITVDVKGEILELKNTINTMVDQLSSFADEVTRVAREVGTDGKLGGQAEVAGVSGTWRGLTENVNFMANNLTEQVRNIAQVTTAVAQGDLSQKITVDAKGEIAELKDTVNTMVEQLRSFAAEVTRVAREVGTEGNLGGQAEVEGVSGTWRGLTENVNGMASNLTDQVRNIAQVATAVANGDLSKQITVDAKGEILELKNTINTMVEQLRSFAAEVTRVAREVGTEGKLGGQAEVEGVSGTWRGLTENVNQLAGNLTTQVRAIAEVSTAVTKGDLTRSIAVEAQGEVAELKDNINQMIANLRDTTKRNEEQDWLKTNLARISGLMQGQRELGTVSQLIMSELTPTVSAQHGAFFLAERDAADEVQLRLIASYGYTRHAGVPASFRLGEGLVGQAAVEKKSILINRAPAEYIRISSGLGDALPANIIVMPLLFEEQLLGVIELASLAPYSDVHRTFLAQLMETLGVVLNTIIANMRTEDLLQQSQSLTQELQNQSEELQAKAALLEERNRDIETKNQEIELARMGVEEKASQLALSSQYKSEFLANMSHELRTPLNSLLILSKMLAANENGNLDERELEFARTIHGAGTDLLELISDILDLSKIEAGKMELLPDLIRLADVTDYVSRTFRPVAADKGLTFEIISAPDLPETVVTDAQRLQQVLKNLLSNAFKFTERGGVTLTIETVDPELVRSRTAAQPLVPDVPMLAFGVHDTGVGIAPEKVAVVFEAFQQADGTTSRKYGGTGLGLSISREIVAMLGGALDVTSTPGVGSTFTLFLPSTHGEPVPLAALGPAPTIADDPTLGAAEEDDEPRLRRLLVIDPGDDVTKAIGGLLGADKGVDLTVASSPAQAATILTGAPWDCVVLALSPPRGPGLDLLDALREHPNARFTQLIAYSPRPLGRRQRARVERVAAGRPVRLATTPAQLLGETAMVLHRRDGFAPLPGPPDVAAGVDGDTAAAGAGRELEGRKVLVVDDDVRNLFALASLLEGRGIEVVFGETGKEALAALERHPDTDLVLMDIMMPDMDGYETTAAIRAMPHFKSLPIIALTAKAMQGDREKSLGAGASDHVTKPVDPGRLLMVLKSWMA